MTERTSHQTPTKVQLDDQYQDEVISAVYGRTPGTTPILHSVEGTGEPMLPKSNPPKRRFYSRRWFKVLSVFLIILAIVATPVAAVGFYTMTVAVVLRSQAETLQVTGRAAYDQIKAQNLPETQKNIELAKTQLQDIRSTYTKLGFYNNIPVARAYYQDGIHGLNAADAGIEASLKTLNSVNKYADVLGFAGEGTFTGGSIENRLKLILETLSKITPELDAISADLSVANAEFAEIDPNRYPETLQGKEVRSRILTAQQLLAGSALALDEFRPVIEQIPTVAGSGGPRKYLVIFQNDNELRATGGFTTAYSIINIADGKVTPEKSDDIYELDKKFTKNIPIPPILGKYLTTETKWHLRDMNTDPDFKVSTDQFLEYYLTLPGEPRNIDGVIAVDTHILTDLLAVLGPVEVPGYGTFSTEISPKCDCPQIIYALSEIITRPTPYIREDRKGILGPMMGAILKKAYDAPKAQWPKLFETGWKNVQGRHAQFYFFDEKSQAAAEKVNAAGRLVKDPAAEDFLAVIDANLGGAKSNLFITSTIDQEVQAPQDGKLTKKVTLTYKNSRRGDNCNLEAGLLCLNARLRDWNRLYLPKGAELIKSAGYREGSVKLNDEDPNFTVLEGEFFLDPLSQSKLEVEYTIPYTNQEEYKIKLWKQGGISDTPVNFDVNGNQETVLMDKDLVYTSAF